MVVLKSLPTEPAPLAKADYLPSRIDLDSLEKGIRSSEICFNEQEIDEWKTFIEAEKIRKLNVEQMPEIELGMQIQI